MRCDYPLAVGHISILMPLAQIHLEVVLPVIVYKRDYPLRSPSLIYAGAVYHHTVHGYTTDMLRLLTDTLDGDVVDRLAIEVVDVVRLPMGRITRCNSEVVHFQLQTQERWRR